MLGNSSFRGLQVQLTSKETGFEGISLSAAGEDVQCGDTAYRKSTSTVPHHSECAQ